MSYLETTSRLDYTAPDHLGTSGNAPTVVLGPGAGAGSFVISGTDSSFSVSVTAGAGTSNNSIIFTATFDTVFDSIPTIVFSPGNPNTASSNVRVWVNTATLTGFTFHITNPSLESGQTYTWRFHIIQ